MSRIRGKDTKLEVKVRSYLFRQGFRFRKNDKRLPGKPDIVLPRYNTVIFIHGCFWHSHHGCRFAVTPKTRTEFWVAKLSRNVEVDTRNEGTLREAGWQVIVLWECDLERDFEGVMRALTNLISASPGKPV
jgi:DNA mismatch endonuclease, patch repair protein